MEQLQQQINGLKEVVESLKNNTTMPFEFGVAMKARLNIPPISNDPTIPTTDIATQTINISGSNAAKPMIGFLTIKLSGVIFNIPFY